MVAADGREPGGWKYTYQADEIRGFVQSHQCSPWTRDYAMLSLFPETAVLEPLSQKRGARFSHDDETAMPHYYSVTFANGIKTEMAPSERACHFRFSFPQEAGSYVVIDPVAIREAELSIDPELALEAYCHDIESDVLTGRKHNFSRSRPGGREFKELGYIPYPDQEYATAITLECAYDDWCAWTLAKAIGNEEMAARFEKTMYNYRNVFDPEVGFMRGRGADGRWTPDFRPTAWGGPFIEGNAFHYTWSVFHDIQGLVNLYGSDEKFCRYIDMVFDFPGIIDLGFYDDVYNEMVEMVAAGLGQYEHGNQPIHHLAYLYDYAGQPWKTQEHVRKIMDKVYNPGPKGYPGDEDQGSMSSWYVMSALGLYSVTPGTSQYAIGSPLFNKATISLENGNKFTIVAENNSKENVYIQSATLNGEPFERNWIDHSEIMAGGELHFVMGPEPNKERCTAKSAAPYSLSR